MPRRTPPPYFPKGIISQSAEAKQKAHRFNATIGIATEARAMALRRESTARGFRADAVTYAAAAGPACARLRKKLLLENPSLADRKFSEPIVTNAITHASPSRRALHRARRRDAHARQALGQLPADLRGPPRRHDRDFPFYKAGA